MTENSVEGWATAGPALGAIAGLVAIVAISARIFGLRGAARVWTVSALACWWGLPDAEKASATVLCLVLAAMAWIPGQLVFRMTRGYWGSLAVIAVVTVLATLRWIVVNSVEVSTQLAAGEAIGPDR